MEVHRVKFKLFIILFIGLFPASSVKNVCLKLLGWRVSSKAKISPNIFLNLKSVTIGENSVIRPFNVFRDVILEIGHDSIIGSWNWISSASGLEGKAGYLGLLKLGNHSSINSRHYFDASGGVIMNDFTVVAGVRSTFITHQINTYESKQTCSSIRIGHHVMIGSNSAFVPGGIRIGNRSVFAMGSVVASGDYGDDSLFAGVPAKFKKKIEGEYFGRTIGAVK